MIITQVRVRPEHASKGWPFSVPAVAQLVGEGLALTRPLTVLVGPNGSGKSTLIEAIAESYGIDVRGGHGGRRYGSAAGRSHLGEVVDLPVDPRARSVARAGKGYFFRAETAAGMLAFMTEAEVPGYGERRSDEVSHGESYLQAIHGRFTGTGLYLLDEAEGPLSFANTLVLLDRLRSLAVRGAQVIYSTHSPMVAALPGAQLLELGDHGVRETSWEGLETVEMWRAFLARPDLFFAD